MGTPLHLARRFFGSLRAGGPSDTDTEWAHRHLEAGERQIWDAMSNPDRRHSIEVAQSVDQRVRTDDGTTVWDDDIWFDSAEQRRERMITAALLHDSGKNASALGTFSRVAATLVRPLVSPALLTRMGRGDGIGRRLHRYWHHPELGAEELAVVGSSHFVVAWTAEHHRPEAKWSVPLAAGRILRDCDND